uniref:Secreted protein n=1 Tax=Mesocestoides corti TaxID=53468 RepID=A0A5K3G411_MESCO
CTAPIQEPLALSRPLQVDFTCRVGHQCLHILIVQSTPLRSLLLSLSYYSATEIALGCVTSLSNNNYACKLFIHMNAKLSCARSFYYCSRQLGHCPTTISLVPDFIED